jgi:hypothetical protein
MTGPLGLRADTYPAVDRGDLQPADVRDRAELLGDLARELARRGQDQRGGGAAVGMQPLDDRHREGERLAGSGPGTGQHVATRDRIGQHERLDLEGAIDPAESQRVDDGL